MITLYVIGFILVIKWSPSPSVFNQASTSEDLNMEMEQPSDYLSTAGTVRCLLCRGLILYKNGDNTRFTAHLANEHAAFFDINYLLASSFMDEKQKNGILDLITSVIPGQDQDESFSLTKQPEHVTGDSPFLTEPEHKKIKTEPENSGITGKTTNILASVGIDLKKSIYFSSVPAVISVSRDQSSFVESVPSLPGWKSKPVKHSGANGRETTITHYLNSNIGIKIRTALGVIEYHRLEGRDIQDLVEICDVLKVGFKKMKKLYSDEDWKCILKSGVLNQQQKMPEENKAVEVNGMSQDGIDKKEQEKEEKNSGVSPNDTNPMSSVADILSTVGIDMKKSKYFSVTSKSVVSTIQARKEAEFKENLTFLPDWKYRTVENSKNGKVSTKKVFLVPNTNVNITTTLGVVECLRLWGQKTEDLVEACNSFGIGFKKFRKLFCSEEWKAISDSGGLAQLKSRYGENDTVGTNEVSGDIADQDSSGHEETIGEDIMGQENPDTEIDRDINFEANQAGYEADQDSTGAGLEEMADSTPDNPDKNKNHHRILLADILGNDGINLKNSLYFSNKKNSVSLVQPRSVELYNETLSFLSGWKYRETRIPMKGKDKETTMRRYLAPNNKVRIDSSLGVVEFLRLEGRNIQELVVICNLFRIGSKKFKKLFSEDVWKTLKDTGALSGLAKRGEGNTKEAVVNDVDSSVSEDISGQDSSLEESKMEVNQKPGMVWNDSIDSDYGEGKLQKMELLEESIDDNSFESSISALDEQLNEFHRELKNDTDQQTEKMMQELSKDLEEIDQDITTAEAAEKTNDEMDPSHSNEKKGSKSNRITSNNEIVVKMMAEQGIDINKSNYFTSTKQAAYDGTKVAHQFADNLVLPGLPDGWKFRKIEAKQNGKIVIQKHYLAPSNIMFKATLGVIELLRLEGKLNPTEILEVAKSLKVGDKKLKRLFNNDSVDGVAEEA